MSADTFDTLVAEGWPFLVSIHTDDKSRVKAATINIRYLTIDLMPRETAVPRPDGTLSTLASLATLAQYAKEKTMEMDAALRVDFITRMKLPGTTVTLEVKEKKLYTYLVQGRAIDTLVASELSCPECGDPVCQSPGP